MKFKYKVTTVDGSPSIADGSIVPGVGVVHDGQIESNTRIDNPNFELVSGGEEPSPAHLNGVVSQTAQPVAPTTTNESEGN